LRDVPPASRLRRTRRFGSAPAFQEEASVRAASVLPRESVSLPDRPEGGYLLIPAVLPALAWWAYREKLIRPADLRVWLTAWEVRARRCLTPLPCRFGRDEPRRLAGLSPRRVNDALRRLGAAGLLDWSESAVEGVNGVHFRPRPTQCRFATATASADSWVRPPTTRGGCRCPCASSACCPAAPALP
jgi:hypothetical protein